MKMISVPDAGLVVSMQCPPGVVGETLFSHAGDAIHHCCTACMAGGTITKA